MDITDLKIIKLLLRNSRATYREIANNLDMTVNAVYKRVQKLNDIGVIRRFTATPNLSYLQGHRILINGESKAKGITKVCKELGKNESIFFVGISGGKYLHIDGEIRNIADLQEYTTYVTNLAEIADPFVGIIHQPKIKQPEPFTKTDERILKTLLMDARKSSVEVAEETGLSAKTVRKALKRVTKKGMVDFSIHWAPNSEKDIIGNFEIYLNKEQNLNDESFQLLKNYPNIVYFQTFSNVPNLIMITTWFNTSKKMQKYYEELETLGYNEVILRVIYNGYFFETWRTNYFQDV